MGCASIHLQASRASEYMSIPLLKSNKGWHKLWFYLRNDEGLLQVGYELVGLLGLDYDVVHVSLNGPPDEVSKAFGHAALVCSPDVLESERHRNVAERSERGDEKGRELVGLFHYDLMIPRVRIKKA